MAADDYVRDMTAQSTAHSSTSAIVGVHEKQPSVLPGPTEMTERQKMMNGDAYLVTDVDLTRGRRRTRPLQNAYNNMPWDPMPEGSSEMPNLRREKTELFGMPSGKICELDINLEPPFYCDYGYNIEFTGPFYANFGCTILDCAKVKLGSRIMCGPNVQIYAATHSVDPAERAQALERAYPITIGDDVWIGGGAIVIGPCTIGDGVTLAAGSVAKGTLEPYCVYGGVPAKLLKRLPIPEGQPSNCI